MSTINDFERQEAIKQTIDDFARRYMYKEEILHAVAVSIVWVAKQYWSNHHVLVFFSVISYILYLWCVPLVYVALLGTHMIVYQIMRGLLVIIIQLRHVIRLQQTTKSPALDVIRHIMSFQSVAEVIETSKSIDDTETMHRAMIQQLEQQCISTATLANERIQQANEIITQLQQRQAELVAIQGMLQEGLTNLDNAISMELPHNELTAIMDEILGP